MLNDYSSGVPRFIEPKLDRGAHVGFFKPCHAKATGDGCLEALGDDGWEETSTSAALTDSPDSRTHAICMHGLDRTK